MTTVELPDPASDAALDELLAFAATVGRPRATDAVRYRAVSSDAVAFQPFVVRGDDHRIVAAALATVSPAIGLDQVQLNGFFAPDSQAAFVDVADTVVAWAGARGAIAVTAHVSAPTGAQLDVWRAAGFEQVGERQRVVRVVGDDDQLARGAIDGAEIVELRDRPELAGAAESLWRAAHRDVPSALRFDSGDLETLRDSLELAPADPWPDLVLVAVTPTGEVVGLAVAIRRYPGQPERVGHRMTAAARDWRGRGVATALKRELLRRGRDVGVTTFEASNDDGNAAMIAINERLGYRLDYRLALLRRAVLERA